MPFRRHNVVSRFALIMALGALAGAAPEKKDPGSGPAAPGATISPTQPTAPAAAISTNETTTSAAPSPAKPVVPKPRPRLSPQLTAELSTQLPVWSPPPAEKVNQTPPPPPDPDVVQMAPVIVKDNRLPRIDEKEWLTPKALDAMLVKEYLTPFDREFLNRFTLPIIGISKEARARMMYEEDKRLDDLKWINDQIDQLKKLDPEAAKELTKVRNDTFTRDEQP
ncbi:MAG: hypothetical protein ABSG50_12155 [Opitutaceae bacterium]|jgi:hypothetical protein